MVIYNLARYLIDIFSILISSALIVSANAQGIWVDKRSLRRFNYKCSFRPVMLKQLSINEGLSKANNHKTT